MGSEGDFPVWALLPKKETGVTSFLNKYPEYDGRGVTIAIFDSGVDPAAPGLQVTSYGETKVIARYDCSGAGDVDTSCIVKPDAEGYVIGLSGRKLKIPSKWKNPSGEYHVGIKNGYRLYPKLLKDRIERERRDKLFDPANNAAIADVTTKLNSLKQTMESVKEPSFTEKLEREELENRLEVLTQWEKKYSDHGPTYDCLVFHDGSKWCACIDTSEGSDLSTSPLLGEYCETHQYVPLTKEDLITISVNVYDNGNLLEIVSICSSHGTHVASIAAACFPEEPEKNGIAPGAQIVSLSIGDCRLDTMETGTAIVRAIIKVMESHKSDKPIHVINMSYGEHSHWSSSGRVGELMNEVVDKYGVVWIAAAGNLGPALSTIGTPPDISTNNIIGVGAYVSPEMMTAQYSLRSKGTSGPYTWTSRGPTLDGGRGVMICAPGGAITSVPKYTLRGAQLFNGTSMASPHAAGAVSCVLSGIKAKNLPYTPYLVHRAVTNTAQFLHHADPFAQGYGLLQVEKAFDYMVEWCDNSDCKVRLNVVCGTQKHKGIYIRDGPQDKPRDVPVSIEPVFADNHNIDLSEKLNFRMGLKLCCNADWVSHPQHVDLMNIVRTVMVRVDPTLLEPGVHNTSILGYDSSHVEKGPVLRLEVTVVRPVVFKEGTKPILKQQCVVFKPGQIMRHFIYVPHHVSQAKVKLRLLDEDKSGGNFVIHAIQAKPKQACRVLQFYKMFSIGTNSEVVHHFQVKGGLIIEIVVAKYWSEQWENKLDYSISLSGCRPDGEYFTMHHSEGIMAVDVFAPYSHAEEIAPSIQLKHNVISVKPTESKVVVCGSRDVIPPSRHIYQLELTYNFHIHKATDVTPNSALLSDYLYESEFESQLWILYDSNKMVVACGDAYPAKYSTKLEKGDYTLKQQIRHEKREFLEKLQDLPLLVSQKLPSSILMEVYSSHSQALLGGKKISSVILPNGNYTVPIYIAPLQYEKHIKSVSVGQFLSGTMALSKGDHGSKVDTYKFKYILTELSKKSSSKNQAEKSKWDEYQEAIRDLKTNWISKFEDVSESEKVFNDVKVEHSAHSPCVSAMLSVLEPKKAFPGETASSESLQASEKIFKMAADLISSVDENQVLIQLATKTDSRPNAATVKNNTEKQKTALIDGFVRKGSAACRLFINKSKGADSGDGQITIESIDSLWQDLHRFIESSDYKSLGMFGVWHAAAHGHMGRLIKYAHKLREEKPCKELEECVVWALRQLGLTMHADLYARSLLVRYPPSYLPF